jgi:hypothetical protein
MGAPAQLPAPSTRQTSMVSCGASVASKGAVTGRGSASGGKNVTSGSAL